MRIAFKAVLAVAAWLTLAACPDASLAQGRTRVSVSFEGLRAFGSHCASCHVTRDAVGADPRAPKLETLQALTPERIYDALTKGIMQVQGAALSDSDRREVAAFLTGRYVGAADAGAASMPNRCKAAAPLTAGPAWNGWGANGANTRFQPAAQAGLRPADLPRLKLKWAFGVPGGIQVFSQPTVVGGWLFMGTDTGQVYALDARTGCVHWSFLADSAVRTAPLVVPGARPVVYIGDLKSKLYALDARSGRLIWSTRLDDGPLSRIVAAPAVADGKLFVAVASGEEGAVMIAGYECCRHRGSVSAVDAATGRVVWKTYTIGEAEALPAGPDGRRRWGPAGAGVWATPTVDAKRGRLYVASGNAYAGPAGALSNAVIALEMATGKVAWARQDVANDVWTAACIAGGPACPPNAGPDFDFAAPVMMQKTAAGRDVLIAAHKGGVAMGLDPDRDGAVIWRRTLSTTQPSRVGDITYGGAADGAAAYFGLQQSGALVAVDVATGVQKWSREARPAPGNRAKLGPGAALTAMPGAILAGGWDGVLRAYGAVDGRELWRFDTARSFETVNRVTAKGGSMGGPGPTVAGGMVFVGSGYIGTSDGEPGNVLLAFGQ